ncbi:MAG TPA: hypothetical protein VFA18_20205 [Gemmataceae bacterium]|nr:hypothetical protein [Gemmataceae bacterium]
MTDKQETPTTEDEQVTELPDRQEMSLLSGNLFGTPSLPGGATLPGGLDGNPAVSGTPDPSSSTPDTSSLGGLGGI